MNKKILGLALLAVCGATFTSFAQDNTTPSSATPKTCTAANCDKGRQLPDPFADLNITDTQRTKLDELNKRVREERKAAATAAKTEKGQRDKAKLEARKDAKKKYLEEVKAIVGPDQYVVFLENFYVNQPGHAKFDKNRRGGDNDKMARNVRKNDRKDGSRRNGDKKNRRNAPAAAPAAQTM